VNKFNLYDFFYCSIAVVLFLVSAALGFFVGVEYADRVTPQKDPVNIHFHYGSRGVNKKPKKYLSQQDVDCLARNIYFESANQSQLGKLAVGLVVMNRVRSDRYPNTICGVVNQRSQFSWVNDGKSNIPNNDWAWKQSQKMAKSILNGEAEFIGFGDVTHYHADYVSPSWSKRMNQVTQVDQHIFYE
tara:strand:- start:6797 stop:7357 length:561 start_codon:yes stop_codon:yes gene_type:complete